LYATAELAPLAAVGGLAAAAAGLSRELRAEGVEIDLVMPDYGGVKLAGEWSFELDDVPAWAAPASVRVGDHPITGHLHLVSVPGIARPHPYNRPDGEGWPDNALRFLAFSMAVASLTRRLAPDVLHLNDWHTGATLAALDPAPPTVLSIHNLAYQGTTGGEWLARIGPRAAHFEWWGGTNPLSGAIALADAIVAVSPNYAREILTPEGGMGLDGALRARGDAVLGIVNGIDTTVWDPATDVHLVATYSASDLAGREVQRKALLDRFGWPDDGALLGAMVTRLTHQKGVDLLLPLVRLLHEVPARLAIVGSGDPSLAGQLTALADAHPGSLVFIDAYDEGLAHQMFAGSDVFVMPSRFEPCGLTQLQAMRYGSVPIVTAVGGLLDTVVDLDASPRTGTGVFAARAESVDVLSALFRAQRRLANKRSLAAIRRRMMSIDWSWEGPARQHVELYERLSES
jgi:starch synthase